jgi:prepilin-type N-terminal cleavage/methylation domain-containing protein
MHDECPAGVSLRTDSTIEESVKQRTKKVSERRSSRERGFSMLELIIVCAVILVISAMALIELPTTMQGVKSDTALREMMDQLRQAREYAIANRRYEQVTFSTVGGLAQIQIIQRNDLTAGAAVGNPILSTVPIQAPMGYLVFPALGDTPDAFGNGNAIVFGGTNGGPAGGMFFQSDGELVNGSTVVAGGSGTPINGSVFLAVTGNTLTARAITVMGTTGRVHGWKTNGTTWLQF